MSSRVLINLFILALAGILFVVYPEQRAAEKAALSDASGNRASAVLGLRSDADLADLAESDAMFRDGLSDSPTVEKASTESWPGLFGRVIDLDGEGVPGLLISLSQPGPSHDGLESTTRILSATTAHDGSFEILVAETPGVLSLGSNEWALLSERRERRGTWRIHSDVLVTAAVHVLGEVRDSSGRPLAGTEVLARALFPLPPELNDTGEQGGFEQRVLSTDNGRFDLGPVPLLASTRIVFEAPGHDPVERRVTSSSVRLWRVVLR